MTRKFKAIGLSLVAVFAMSAIVASSASATEFTAASYPVTYSGSQPAGSPHQFVADGFTTTCEVATFSGTASATSTTTTVTPKYEKCKTAGIASTVTLNGCDYLFHLPASGFLATVDLVCSGSNEITIDVGAELSKPICQVHVPPFAGKSHVLLANDHPGVLATATVSGIKANLTDSQPFLCPFNGNTVVENSTYNGAVTLTGAGGNTIDVG